MQDKLLELERKISENKMLLNNMQSDIAYMEQQVAILRREVAGTQEVKVQQSQRPYYVQPNRPPQMAYQAGPQAHPTAKPVAEKQPKDMETAVGKTIMGIAASVLIFISLVLFAKLIIPYLTDTIKQILMYVVSIGITTFGLVKLNKSRDSVLFLSISACGVGSLFISLFLSHVYFDTYNEIVLYVLLFIWAVGVCVLSKLRSEVFNIIGQTGILISVYYGMQFCVRHNDINKMLIITIYFIVGSLIFYFTHNNSKKNFIISSVYNIINVFILFWGIEDYSCESAAIPALYNAGLIILLVYIVFKMVLPLFWSGVGHTGDGIPLINKYENATGGINTGYFVAVCMVLVELINSDDIQFPVMLISFSIYLVATEYIRRNQREVAGINILYGTLTSMMILSVYGIVGLHKLFGVSIIIIPYMIYGFIMKKRAFKYMSIFAMLIFIFSYEIYLTMQIILGVAMLAGAMYLTYTKKEQYSLEFKNVLLVFIMLFAVCLTDRLAGEYIFEWCEMRCLRFVLLSIIAGVAAKTAYIKNPVTGAIEQGTKIFVNAIIAWLMILGLNGISGAEPVAHLIIYIIFTLALFMLNAKEQLRDKDLRWYGPYVGIKFTILMVVILTSLEAESFIVSIFCFLFAVASISVGFFVKHKELRVYGLVLSLISVVKLIMIDITYDNNLGHALSFFISGLLCFAISAIYTRVEKSVGNEVD